MKMSLPDMFTLPEDEVIPQSHICLLFDVQCIPKFKSESLCRARNFLSKISATHTNDLDPDQESQETHSPFLTDLELAIEAEEQSEGLNIKIRLLLRRIFDYLILLLFKQSSLSFATTNFSFVVFDSQDPTETEATHFHPITIESLQEFESAVEKHVSRLQGTELPLSFASTSTKSHSLPTKDSSVVNQSENFEGTSEYSVASWVTESSKQSQRKLRLRLSDGTLEENGVLAEVDFDSERNREDVIEQLNLNSAKLDLSFNDLRPVESEGQNRLEALKNILERIIPMLEWPKDKLTKVVSVVFEVPKKFLEYRMINIGDDEMKQTMLTRNLNKLFKNKGIQYNFLDTSQLLSDPLRRDIQLEDGLNVEGDLSQKESPMKRGDVIGTLKSFLNSFNGGQLYNVEELNCMPPENIPYAMMVRKLLENEKVCERGGPTPFAIQRMLAAPDIRPEPQELEIFEKKARKKEKLIQTHQPQLLAPPVIPRGKLLVEAARASYMTKNATNNRRPNKRSFSEI